LPIDTACLLPTHNHAGPAPSAPAAEDLLALLPHDLRYLRRRVLRLLAGHSKRPSLAALLRTCKYLAPDVRAATVKLAVARWYSALPDQLPLLEDLTVEDCMTSELASLNNLTALQKLRLSGCGQMRSLPGSIGDLAALRQLSLSGCGQLQTLPGSIGNMAALQVLSLPCPPASATWRRCRSSACLVVGSCGLCPPV
jgi:hypothetical protein